MQQRTLGTTGVPIGTFALGTMMFGAWGNPDHDDCARIVHRALDAGVTLIDTADVYSDGESEVIVGKAIRGRRDDVVLATKFGMSMSDDPMRSGGSPRWIRKAVEDSLRRLGTDHIDLYQMHRPDFTTDLHATLGTLNDLISEGKVRFIGESMYPADRLVEAQWAARDAGLQPFRTEQLRYSILSRTSEELRMPAAQRYGMGVLTFAPLNAGWLAGRENPADGHRKAQSTRSFDTTTEANRRRIEIVRALERLAADAGLTMIQLALGFVLSHPAVTATLLGPRTLTQLEGLLEADGIALDGDLLDAIDALVAPGTEVNPEDNYKTDVPALQHPHLRRR